MPEVISQAAPPAAEPDDEAPARRTAGQRALQLLDAAWRPALLLVLLGFGWWAVTAAEVFPAYLVPTPGDVANELVTEREMLARHTWVTTYETVLGFLLAAAIGMLAAVVIVYSPTLEKALYPLILFAQVIPKIAIAPILVVWFGFGPMPKVILAVLIAFFPVVVSGVAGLRSTDPELLDLSATMGASRWKTFRKIRFPNSLPHLLSGLKVAVTLAVVGAVVGEFVGADEGLGYVLLLASGNLNSSLLFADLILMSALGVVLFVAVEVAEKLLIPWHASRRQGVPLTTS